MLPNLSTKFSKRLYEKTMEERSITENSERRKSHIMIPIFKTAGSSGNPKQRKQLGHAMKEAKGCVYGNWERTHKRRTGIYAVITITLEHVCWLGWELRACRRII